MRTRLWNPAATLAALAATAIGACVTSPEPQRSQAESPPLAFPAGEVTMLRLHARGTQNYECREKSDAPGHFEWVLVAPEAELFDASGKRVVRHYAGPTWESTVDGSKVTATVKTRVDAPEPDAIPWLLLAATKATGDGIMAQVKSVQRTDTHGGKAPAGECTTGQTVKVPYTAVYWFSRAGP
jgi:hypothetical protein